MANNENVKDEATLDSFGGVEFSGDPKIVQDAGFDKAEIVATLQDYWREADNNRKGGMNPRDAIWQRNLDLYWNRYDFSAKQKWQAQETMPEVPSFVDRFAAALKEALIQTPDGFYTVSDPADTENDMGAAIKRVVDVWLSSAGRNQTGQLLPYSSVFEEQMKMGAIMASSAVVTWKNDIKGGRVAVESVDPRMIWLDHTYRNLYRIRRIELDRHELAGMRTMTDGKGVSIFDEVEIDRLESSLLEKNIADAQRTGTGQMVMSGRRPIELDEYIATVIGRDGRVLADRALMVIANRNYLIRGPEKNPFWHGKDWLTYTPLVTAPLSVYGRSYMEDFGSVAKTFNDLTNMIIDAVHTSSLNAFAMVPSMLLNPNQVAEGISPNKIFMLEDGYKASDFATELALGSISPDGVKVWQAMKQELTEAAGINEIGLGQFAPKGRTSATEITETQQSSSALIRSVAQTVETRFLDPQLDLIWKTGMQHADPNNQMLQNAAGEEMWQAMIGSRKELVKRPITFQARGISSLISRSQQLKTLMSILSVIGQNQILMQAFLQEVDIGKLVERILFLSGIDVTKLQLSDREKMIKSLANPIQQAQQNVPPGTPQAPPQTQNAIGGAVKALGVGR
jgi:hypothetical protein